MSKRNRYQAKTRSSFRKFILITGSIGIVLMTLTLGVSGYFLFNNLLQTEIPDLSNLTAQQESGFAVLTPVPTIQSVVAAGSSGPLRSIFGSALPEEPFIDRLLENQGLEDAPRLRYTQQPLKEGPSAIEYLISSNGVKRTHTIGQATAASTDVVGAAAEWTVRPWWKPGWVPQTVDCGQEGTTAIGGHVSWGSKPGPFYSIGAMSAGDVIRCLSSEGRWYEYKVAEVVRIDYSETRYYWESRESLNPSQLTLFSCTPEITGIIVVRAELISNLASLN
ncbi:MAG: class F sortase [Chloroflexota bacterium]